MSNTLLLFSGFEIPRIVEIGNQPSPCRAPFLRERAGSRHVGTYEHPAPAKVLACLLRRLGDDRHLQAPMRFTV